MRTILATSIIFLAALSPVHAAAKLRVVATTPDLAALATAVGGDDVQVTALARAGEDPHFVDPKPSFIVTLNQADVLIEGGAALEAGWLPPLLDGARNPRIESGAPGRIVASAGLALRDVPSELNRALGDVHPFGNPHYLLDPVNAKTVAQTIATGFCAVDPGRCAGWQAGATRLAAAIDGKLPEWQAALAGARGTKIVTYHKDYDYLAARFGLEIVDNLEPKPGIPPSPTHLAELVPRMQAEHVRLILAEPYRGRQTLDFVAEKTGAKVVVLPIMPDGKEAADYVGLIDHDVREIAAALRG
jgi:zinc/manganese transport system substrate-binding protein